MATSPSGLLLIDKPAGHTSHDVVARTRRLAGTRKVGHAGTLDPMATGLLILGLESSTRLLTYVVGCDKEYTATIRLGQSSSTDDAEGELSAAASADDLRGVDQRSIEQRMRELTGEIEQVPSTVSAIKVDGKRAYARARAGEHVELAARQVTVSEFELDALRRTNEHVDVDVRVACSSGTYVRALARDIGAALGVGGHLTRLRRTRIGPFSVRDAAALDGLVVADRIIAPADAARSLFPTVNLDDARARALGHGQRIDPEGFPAADGPIAAIAQHNRLIGLVEVRGSTARSLVNFPDDERNPL
ncbi:tRNA pseudouridine(55) synthase TruB [Paramicrobacterium agarici]|uniref:tRNA pseudouridine synthase B n=1 Tax=Paramicrobacterium agarici TaxID=630514 RepID=A0A2A9DWB5_9MICO|nr:tRNA pseudouridine(55) synthase TruB [Microbacterium agarici]PFG30978.1 tRNA pseudouridine synthase B [Microbacterium agarici]